MKVCEELGEVSPETSILFLGSGFSLGAKNISDESPPNGSALRKHFVHLLGLPEDTSYDIQILSEEFAEDNPVKLRDELYRIFRISETTQAQESILKEPWRRIYTTNYDDVVETYRLKRGKSPDTFDVS